MKHSSEKRAFLCDMFPLHSFVMIHPLVAVPVTRSVPRAAACRLDGPEERMTGQQTRREGRLYGAVCKHCLMQVSPSSGSERTEALQKQCAFRIIV